MRALIAIVVISWLWTGIGAAQPAEIVSLTSGESVVLQIDRARPGRAALIERGAARPLSARDLSVALGFAGGDYDWAAGENYAVIPGGPKQPAAPIQPNVVRVSFLPIPGHRDMLLVIENGLDQAFGYRARLNVGLRSAQTDVCNVAPGQRGYEHWPYAIDRIDLSGFALEPWRPGQSLTCE